MRFALILFLAGLSFALSGCSRRDASGAYLAKFANGVYWLQLVQTPDNHVTGQLDILRIVSDGNLEYNSLSITGAANGNNISLLLKPIPFLPITEPASGVLDGDKLALTGGFTQGQPTTIVLERSDANQYKAQASILREQSQATLAAKAGAEAKEKAVRQQRDLIARLNQVVDRIEHFNASADALLAKFPMTEKQYQAITSKMREYLIRQRELPSSPNASYERGQIRFAMNQGTFTTGQVHHDVQSVQSDFRTNAAPLMSQVIQLEEGCRHNNSSTAVNAARPDAEAWTSTCQKLVNAVGPYRQRFDAVARSLARLEETYQEELKKQRQLVQEAQQAGP